MYLIYLCCADPANAGLSIIRDMLLPVKTNHPEVSCADLWALGGAAAVEFMGGPKIPFRFGRTDALDASACPPNGRLPDAAQGAGHLRDVFGRMGFNDQEIVALSGGHTVGRCHIVRSGFDGPWTRTPLQFNNEYFKNLIELEWVERKWEGPRQFQDTKTGALMMLPTDIALIRDPAFLPFVQAYAADEKLFFKDFAAAYGKLLALGCPAKCDPSVPAPPVSERDAHSAEFRDLCMHGSLEPVMKYAATADVHQLENTSGRSALHKAAFWGHIGTVQYLVRDLKLNIDVQVVRTPFTRS
jgi:catalase (peroxidase I)